MNWTRKPPTKKGYYWLCVGGFGDDSMLFGVFVQEGWIHYPDGTTGPLELVCEDPRRPWGEQGVGVNAFENAYWCPAVPPPPYPIQEVEWCHE